MISVFNGRTRRLGEGGKESGYIQVAFVLRDHMGEFGAMGWYVFTQIALHSDKNGHCYPSVARMARKLKVDDDTVRKALNHLCDLRLDGYRVLCRVAETGNKDNGGKFGPNQYIIFPDEAVAREADEAREQFQARRRAAGAPAPPPLSPIPTPPMPEKPVSVELVSAQPTSVPPGSKESHGEEEPVSTISIDEQQPLIQGAVDADASGEYVSDPPRIADGDPENDTLSDDAAPAEALREEEGGSEIDSPSHGDLQSQPSLNAEQAALLQRMWDTAAKVAARTPAGVQGEHGGLRWEVAVEWVFTQPASRIEHALQCLEARKDVKSVGAFLRDAIELHPERYLLPSSAVPCDAKPSWRALPAGQTLHIDSGAQSVAEVIAPPRDNEALFAMARAARAFLLSKLTEQQYRQAVFLPFLTAGNPDPNKRELARAVIAVARRYDWPGKEAAE